MSSPLSLQQLQSIVPSAFAVSPIETASSQYGFVKTIDVIEKLMSHGWSPVKAGELKTTSNSKMGFQYHSVSFENDKLINSSEFPMKPSEGVFRLMLTNGHDTAHALTLRPALFRQVCSNGLVIGTNFIKPIRLVHSKNVGDHLSEILENIIPLATKVSEAVKSMMATTVSGEQKLAFAEFAYELRHGKAPTNPISLTQLLTPAREFDQGDDLWRVFNVVQENIMNGYYSYPIKKSENRSAMYKSKPITSVLRSTDINSSLFDFAMTLAS